MSSLQCTGTHLVSTTLYVLSVGVHTGPVLPAASTPRFLHAQPPQSAAFPSMAAIVSIHRRSAATDNVSHAIPCPAPASAHPLALAPVFEEVLTLPPSSTPLALPHPPNPWSLLDSPDYRGAAHRIYGAASVLIGIRRGGSCLPGIGAACLRSEMDRIRDDRRGGVSTGGVPRPPRRRLRSNGGGGPRDLPRSKRRRGERLMLFGGGGCASRDHSDDISDESLGGDDAEQELAPRYHQQRRSPSTAPPPPSPPLLHHASAPASVMSIPLASTGSSRWASLACCRMSGSTGSSARTSSCSWLVKR
jgi:hypothetical protein